MIFRALVWRPLRERPSRFLMTILGVAAGVGSLLATILSSRAAVSSMREGAEEIAGRARLVIAGNAGPLPLNTLATLREFSGNSYISPVVEEFVLLENTRDVVRLLGVDLLADSGVRDVAISTRDGADPGENISRILRGEGVAISDGFARRARVRVGDSLQVSVRGKSVALPVVATFTPARLASAWDTVVLADVARVQELFGRAQQLDRIEIAPRREAAWDSKELEDLRARLLEKLGSGVLVEKPEDRSEGAAKLVRSLQFNLTALSGISLLVGAVLVATTLYTSVVRRRASIAMLRSLGASPGQLAGALVGEALLIGTLGGCVGLVAAWFGSHAAVSDVRATLAVVLPNAPGSQIVVLPRDVLLGFALGIFTSLAAVWLPLREALRTPPIQGLRRVAPETLSTRQMMISLALGLALAAGSSALLRLPAVADLPIFPLLSALGWLLIALFAAPPLLELASRIHLSRGRHGGGITLRLASAILAAGRRRAAWGAGAIAVAAGLAVAVATMVTSFRGTVETWVADGVRADLWVRPVRGATGIQIGRLDPRIVADIQALLPEAGVDPFHARTIRFRERNISLNGAEFEVVQRRGGVPFRDGRPTKDVFALAARNGSFIINESLAYRCNLREGDLLRIETPSGILERPIEGVFYDYSAQHGLAIIDNSIYLRYFPADGPSGVAVFMDPGADVDAAARRLRGAFQGRYLADVMLNRELRGEILKVFDQTFAITIGMQWIAALVAVVAVISVLYALVSERRQDLAVLRVLGAARAQLLGVILAEAGWLGAIGLLSGASAGLVIGHILVKDVNLQSFGWTLQFMVPTGWLAGLSATVVGACLVAAIPPALRAISMEPIEGLRDEG